ncbi:MAG: alpha-amylase family glycosyl hydrolase [Chloroflexota bacterium]
MSDYKWWQRGVVYQIYPRSFNDSNGDGVGDLQGIIDKLDYLNDGTEQSLGIDAIWISPFYPSPMVDFGYDVADYTDVDPLFGDLETFDKLVEAAHAHNIKVIIDFVPNHTSDQHAWFKESRTSKDNPKRDWYIWRDPQPDGSPPNNWGSMFGGRAWTYDEATEQYYFHQFAPEQPDLNWRNPEVRAAMHNVLRFWMNRGVDGFRMDVVYVIWKHPDMPDQPLIEGAKGRTDDDRFVQQQQIYALNYEGIQDIMAEIRAVLDEQGAIGIAELWMSVAERMEYYQNFELPFNFDFIGEWERYQWDAEFFRSRIDTMEEALPQGAWGNYVLGNHDIQRMASRYGAERARVAAMLLLTLRGTPTLYNGDELGMQNGDISPEQIVDPQGKILGVAHTRDVTRTPLQWDDTTYAGFSEVAPWLPVSEDYKTRNVVTMREIPTSILTLYRRLIWYRKNHDSLAVGDYQSLPAPDDVYLYLRTHGDERHLIALNFGTDTHEITMPADGTLVMNTSLTRADETFAEHDKATLYADEGLLIRLT